MGMRYLYIVTFTLSMYHSLFVEKQFVGTLRFWMSVLRHTVRFNWRFAYFRCLRTWLSGAFMVLVIRR
jgi:hypothetical protein